MAQAADGMTKTELKPFNVTVRVFDPAKGLGSGQDVITHGVAWVCRRSVEAADAQRVLAPGRKD